jgi:hypothetical protein
LPSRRRGAGERHAQSANATADERHDRQQHGPTQRLDDEQRLGGTELADHARSPGRANTARWMAPNVAENIIASTRYMPVTTM